MISQAFARAIQLATCLRANTVALKQMLVNVSEDPVVFFA